MLRKMKRTISKCLVIAVTLLFIAAPFMSNITSFAKGKEDVIKLRVCNWEEYIDLGDWDEEEKIELENGITILGENTMMDDFCTWYYETYGKRVEVEYSCFGTNEDLYNQLTLGDTYDLVCPSEYMIMKLMSEDRLQPLSQDFFDKENENNYYVRGLSPFINDAVSMIEINGECWSKYAAGYMWGVTGILYNPEGMSAEDAATWKVVYNPDYFRRITIKDNVRDSYFVAVGALKSELLTSEQFVNAPDYRKNLAVEMNDVDMETILDAQDLLQDMRNNIYAFETDSGKADIVSGKIVANYQWSGDAVYSMDIAEEDDVFLEFAVPEECTNLWFDGWVMLKDGINGDSEKQQAAEAFINFMSMPVNAIRNMNYIGYTSVISGGEDDTIISYVNWKYGAEEDEENIVEYPVGFFFVEDSEAEEYVILTSEDQARRQLFAQYPSQDVLERSAIMQYFDTEASKNTNQMWINVRCFNIKDVTFSQWCIVLAVLFAVILIAAHIRMGHYRE